MALQIIGIVGLPGSGKTEIARALADFSIPSVRMGDVVWNEIRRRGQRVTEKNVARVSNELRKKEGMSSVARRCVPLVRSAGEGKKVVVVDGIRGIAEVNEFRRAFGGNFHLIAVWAGEKARSSRISSRKRADDTITRMEFHEKDLRELSWGLGDALALADVMFINEGTLDSLHEKVLDFYKVVGGEP